MTPMDADVDRFRSSWFTVIASEAKQSDCRRRRIASPSARNDDLRQEPTWSEAAPNPRHLRHLRIDLECLGLGGCDSKKELSAYNAIIGRAA
jgi:hypothetical protein